MHGKQRNQRIYEHPPCLTERACLAGTIRRKIDVSKKSVNGPVRKKYFPGKSFTDFLFKIRKQSLFDKKRNLSVFYKLEQNFLAFSPRVFTVLAGKSTSAAEEILYRYQKNVS